MQIILRYIAFGSFQIVNTLTGFLMTFFPKAFHESLFENPQMVYVKLGFSPVAVEMLHNVIRGHGAVLLAVSVFLWIERMKTRSTYLLIFLVCALSVYTHVMTLNHHLRSPEIAGAIGTLTGLYVTIGISAAVGIINAFVYFTGKPTA